MNIAGEMWMCLGTPVRYHAVVSLHHPRHGGLGNNKKKKEFRILTYGGGD